MKKNKTTHVHNLIIVDESGSMGFIRQQAFSGMNETLQTVRQLQKQYPDQQQHVTLLTFAGNRVTLLYDNAAATEAKDLRLDQYRPNGCTPLYDAIGMGISKVQSHAHKGDHVLATIITDGEENSSCEWTLQNVRKMIEQLKKQNWTFALIGTENLDVENMAHDFAISNHLTFRQDEEGTSMVFEDVRRCMSYMNACVAENLPIAEGQLFEEAEAHAKDTDPITITF